MIFAGIRLEVRVPGQKIDDEEEKDARDKINAQGMNVPGALPFDELVRQTPRFEEKKTERLEKTFVEIQECVGGIGQERSKGAVIIDSPAGRIARSRGRSGSRRNFRSA